MSANLHCPIVSLKRKHQAAKRKHTHLLVTEVKRDFQTNSQKNHEYHQRNPEPHPQGHGSPCMGVFMIVTKD